MNKLIEITVGLTIFSSIFGPSIRLPINLPPLNIYISDILVGILVCLLSLRYRKINLIIKNDKPAKILIVFLVIALISLILSPINLTLTERLISSLYIGRFTSYFGIYLACLFLVENDKNSRKNLLKYLSITGITFLVVGWLQYVLYPDLRNLSYLGWDPHYKRIFGLIFDPNYLGLILVFYFFMLHTLNKLNPKGIFIQILCLVTIGFTYSRSSFLALFSSLIFLAYKNKNMLNYLGLSLILVFFIVLLPRPGGAGVKLERIFSVKERILNWQYATQLVIKNPILGVGFNTLRYAKKNYKELPDDWLTSHSAAGIDNSFLFVAATTGFIGLSVYLYFIYVLFNNSGVLGKTVLIAVVIHSLFLNSLFFSYILIWFWVIIAVDRIEIKGSS